MYKSETKIKEPLTASKLKLIRTIYAKGSGKPDPKNTEYLYTPKKNKNNPLLEPPSAKPKTARGLTILKAGIERMATLEVLDDQPFKLEKPLQTTNKGRNLIRTIETSKPKSVLEHTGNTMNDNITESRKKDENEVKRLNIWEKDILNQDLYNDPQFQISKKELECINWKNDIRDKLSKINMSSNNFYEDLVKSAEREQGSILFQNINITKKKFQFDIFRGNDVSKGGHTRVMSTGESEKDEVMNQYKELKQDENYDNIIKTDYYREIIKEKIKLEMSYTKELNILAQKIFDMKQKKSNHSHEVFEIINYLKDMEKDYEVRIYPFIFVEKDRNSRK
jgi:hypothetical protein